MVVVQSRVPCKQAQSVVELAAVEQKLPLLPSMQSSLGVLQVVGQVAEAVAEGCKLAGEQTDSCSSHRPDGMRFVSDEEDKEHKARLSHRYSHSASHLHSIPRQRRREYFVLRFFCTLHFEVAN